MSRTGRRTRPVFAQNGRNQRRNESFSQFGAENSQNGNFSQNAERRRTGGFTKIVLYYFNTLIK